MCASLLRAVRGVTGTRARGLKWTRAIFHELSLRWHPDRFPARHLTALNAGRQEQRRADVVAVSQGINAAWLRFQEVWGRARGCDGVSSHEGRSAA